METLDLPCLANIFFYLDLADRLNAELVCKRWLKAVSLTAPLKPIDIRIYFVADIQIRRKSIATIQFGDVFFEKFFPTTLNNNNANLNNQYNEEICKFLSRLLNRFGDIVGGVYLGGAVNNIGHSQNPDFETYRSIRTIIYPTFLELFNNEKCRKNLHSFSLKCVSLQPGSLNVLNANGIGSTVRTMCFDDVLWTYNDQELQLWGENIPRWERLSFCSTSVYLLNAIGESLTLSNEYLNELHIYGRPFDILASDSPDENFLSIFGQVRRITLNVDTSGRKYHHPLAIALEQTFLRNSNITRLELCIRQGGPDLSDLFVMLQYLHNTLTELKLTSFERPDDERRYCVLNNDHFNDLINYVCLCGQLKSFYLTRICRGVTDFSPLFNVNSLQRFGIDGADNFSDDVLIPFVISSENLQFLSLHNCPQIQGFHLRRVLDVATSLVGLEAVNCGNFTNTLANALIERRSYRAANDDTLQYCRFKRKLCWSNPVREKLQHVLPWVVFPKKSEVRICLEKERISEWKSFKNYLIPRFDCCQFCHSLFSNS